MRTAEQRAEKKKEVMVKCFDCYCENGLNNTNMKLLASACDMSQGNLYVYFNSIDDLVVETTAYCMSLVEEDFIKIAPSTPNEIMKFIDEVPEWTLKNHGKKYRFMYQVYTSPKYYEEGQKFVHGITKRYMEYATMLEKKLGIDRESIFTCIVVFVRAIVHYALFEEKEYMEAQINLVKKIVKEMKNKK